MFIGHQVTPNCFNFVYYLTHKGLQLYKHPGLVQREVKPLLNSGRSRVPSWQVSLTQATMTVHRMHVPRKSWMTTSKKQQFLPGCSDNSALMPRRSDLLGVSKNTTIKHNNKQQLQSSVIGIESLP
jgi:hypothetical protein